MVGALVVAGLATFVLTGGTSKDDQFIAAVEEAGLQAEMPSEARGVEHARDLCEALGSGQRRWGPEIDEIAVDVYCADDKQFFQLDDDRFLAELERNGLASKFDADAAAIAYANRFCRELEDGEPPEGEEEDRLAVETYCPEFESGFRVLRSAVVDGLFELTDSDWSSSDLFPSIEVDGTSCNGGGGYSDIRRGTIVKITNGVGDLLTTTALEDGVSLGSGQCLFSFEFEVEEGEDRYVVSVGRRGELEFSFDELMDQGVGLSLGD